MTQQLNCAEAYRLMLYRNKATGREEWLWNSRDGVTPFCIPDPEGGEMQHVEWHRDVFAPFHVPDVGDRIFVDLTETRAKALAARNANRFFEEDRGKEWDPRHRWDTPEAMAKDLAKDYLRNPGEPDILVVNSAMREQFLARAKAGPQRTQRKSRFA